MSCNQHIITKQYRRSILVMLAEGDRPAEIAKKLNKSVGNIRETIKIMRRLAKARSTVQLVVMYREGKVPVNFPFKQREHI